MNPQTIITEVELPRSELGNDANDHRDDPTYLDRTREIPAESMKTLAELKPLDIECMLRTNPKPRSYLFCDQDGEGILVSGIGAGIADRVVDGGGRGVAELAELPR